MDKNTSMENEYYKSKESVQEYIHMAEGFNGKVLIEKLEQVLAPNSTLLEIGSGPGTDWRILNATYEVTGSDNSDEFLRHLANENPNCEFVGLDAVTLKTDKKFEGIYSNKVLHHLSDNELVDSIKRQAAILNPNGIICHSFWKGEGSETFKGMFVNYHGEADLGKMFSDNFEVLSLNSYKEFDDDDSLLLIGRKK